jgi:arylformamidase
MLALIHHNNQQYRIDLSEPLDISMPLRSGVKSANAWYASAFEATPVVMGDFVGSVAQGGFVNFCDVKINPHGNGTHTECVGHISKEPFTINQCLQTFFFLAKVISIFPIRMDNGDHIIYKELIQKKMNGIVPEALIIRSLPNDRLKMTAQYSGKNPPYFHHDALNYLQKIGVKHLLTDLPSVDREEDGGKLLAHRAFWQYPHAIRSDATITELIYVPAPVQDGNYFLNLQIASFELDASPSKPVLYKII